MKKAAHIKGLSAQRNIAIKRILFLAIVIICLVFFEFKTSRQPVDNEHHQPVKALTVLKSKQALNTLSKNNLGQNKEQILISIFDDISKRSHEDGFEHKVTLKDHQSNLLPIDLFSK